MFSWKKIKKIQIPLKKSIWAVIFALTACLSFIAIFIFYGIINSYTEFISTETSDFLTLYTKRMETNLSQVEKLSYNILCNNNIQNNLSVYNETPTTYQGYSAYTNLYNTLFMQILDENFVQSGYFIFNDGSKMTLKVRSIDSLPDEFLKNVQKAAAQAHGKDIWMADPNNSSVLVCAKQINATTDSDKFSQKGILILKVNPELFNYDSSNEKFKFDLCCFVNGNTVISPSSSLTKGNIEKLSAQTGNGIVTLDQKKYFFVIKNSSIDGWKFICFSCYDTMMTDISHASYLYVLLFVIAAFLAMMLISILSSRICKPITQVIKYMDAVKNQIFKKISYKDTGTIKVEESVELIHSYNLMVEKIDYLINEVYYKQLTISDMRYKMLQQQINPHFLYNTLDTIHWEAVSCGDNQSATMALNLSKLLRGAIKMPDTITLGEDLSLLTDYLSIQKIRFEERLKFHQDDPTRYLNYQIPKMTLQPIVENCIRHNLEKYDRVCNINLSFVGRDDGFSIFVKDNGQHTNLKHIERVMQGKESSHGTGIGLKNIEERLHICFGEEASLHITAGSDGTCVEIKIPYRLLDAPKPME